MNNDALLDAIGGALPPMMTTLEALNPVVRQMHSPRSLGSPELAVLANTVEGYREQLAASLQQFADTEFPDDLRPFKTQVQQAGDHVLCACQGVRDATTSTNNAMAVRQVLGQCIRAWEVLYPIANVLPPVSRFFLAAAYRGDEALQAKLQAANASRGNVGIMHADNDRAMRGGFSLYVPEYYDASHAYPLIVTLHGGSGHGRDFLWTWLVEARTHGAILLSPTAQDKTWSLMGRDIDTPRIADVVERIGKRWNLDRQRMLLTGVSDGGTFCYICGLRDDSPFTHLAPSAANFHPLLLTGRSQERLQNLPVYLMHGARDETFPVQTARDANAALSAADMAVQYREIADLSHAWPQDENPKILNWLFTHGS